MGVNHLQSAIGRASGSLSCLLVFVLPLVHIVESLGKVTFRLASSLKFFRQTAVVSAVGKTGFLFFLSFFLY